MKNIPSLQEYDEAELSSLPDAFKLCRIAGTSYEVAKMIHDCSGKYPVLIYYLLNTGRRTTESLKAYITGIDCWDEDSEKRNTKLAAKFNL